MIKLEVSTTNSQGAGQAQPPLELWGGLEATVNRYNDTFYDQVRLSGHYDRADDIVRLAETGIKALRYPVLWEHHAADPVDWSWAEARLNALRTCGINVIAGLVHHGSGPRHTNLLDPGFVAGLAGHAQRVAERFPWIEDYTPVNEPLTTARFSCLYGHWYPHARDALSFARALFIETAATRAAMRAVRKINPRARLVQTEDTGKVYSTPALVYQAEFENERRWLSFDLLCGRVDPNHPMWSFLRWIGVTEDELKPFLDDPCPPDILGVNYYVTSDRFLDERLHEFPRHTHGGNHRQGYADISAVRICASPVAGVYGALKECWERYKIPTAVTECHISCTREEQIRWLMETWRSAQQLRGEGADIRAVTAWSLLGAHDWDSLLTQQRGHYESGVYDLRSPKPRPTALVKCLQSLSRTGKFDHPVVATEGWWRRPIRFVHDPVRAYDDGKTQGGEFLWRSHVNKTEARPLLITGATGTLGRAFRRLCDLRGLPYQILTRQEMDICNLEGIARAMAHFRPWAVINTAGYVRVNDAESERERCFRENTLGPAKLAKACVAMGVKLVTFSSDLVFNGSKNRPYVENDRIAPMNMYGRSKAEAERWVLDILPSTLLIRTSAFFGPWDDHNFMTVTLRKLRQEEPVTVANDAWVSPTYVPQLVHTALDLLIDGESGIWHLANKGAMTWAQWARFAAEMDGAREDLIIEKPLAEINYPAPRPGYSVLGSERGNFLGPVEDALCRYFEERRAAANARPCLECGSRSQP